MKFFSEHFFSPDNHRGTALFIYFSALVARILMLPYFMPVYDETAYSATALRIVETGEWFNIYGSNDLFFFPPLFKWFSAVFVLSGFERLIAVRSVAILLSSGIPAVLFLLLKKSGLNSKKALTAAFLWIMFPGATHFSIAGQVETPFIFLALLSFWFFVKRDETPFLNLFLLALFISASIWTKETAFGFIPVFVFIMAEKKEFANIFKWSSVTSVLVFPLLVQSFLPHSYDIFYELTNDHITWNAVSFIQPFVNMGILMGVTGLPEWLTVFLNVCVAAFFIYCAVFCFKKYRNIELVRFSVFSIVIFFVFFSVFPKKFDYYLLPVLLFFLVCFIFTAKDSKVFSAVFAIFVCILSFNGLYNIKSSLDINYDASVKIIRKLSAEEVPWAEVVSPTPEIFRYIAEKKGYNIKFSGIDFTSLEGRKTCMKAKDRCILNYDYYITDDMFFEIVFCSTWPIKIENCDIEAMKHVINHTELILSESGLKLYRIRK